MSWKVFDTEGRLLINDGGSGVCAPVIILDIVTNVPIATIASGGIYRVAVLDAIDAGYSDTTYVNQIISAQ